MMDFARAGIAREHGALTIVDAVTSLGGHPLDVGAWGIDACYSCTQKCLGVPPGLAPLTVSDRARDRLVERSPSWYLDLRMIGRYTGPATGARTYHHTAPVSMVMSLHAGLGALLDEGLDAAVARHAECGRLLHEGLVDLGFAPCGCPRASTTPRPAPPCSTATASRSAGGWASSPAGCGASGAWATPPARATSRCSSGRWPS